MSVTGQPLPAPDARDLPAITLPGYPATSGYDKNTPDELDDAAFAQYAADRLQCAIVDLAQLGPPVTVTIDPGGHARTDRGDGGVEDHEISGDPAHAAMIRGEFAERITLAVPGVHALDRWRGDRILGMFLAPDQETPDE